MKKGGGVHKIAFILLIIGGLNWLLVGVMGQDLGSYMGGMDHIVWKIIYILVGLSAIYEIVTHKANCKHCGSMSGGSTGQQM